MYINVNNVKIYYECSGNGRPIILLHGNTDNTRYMKHMANMLAKDYKVYLIDRRGSGKSDKNCILTYEETAKDIYEFIKKNNLESPIVLGHSGGARVAMQVAINYQDIVSKLILCSRSYKKKCS